MWNIGLSDMASVTPEHFVEMMKYLTQAAQLIYPGSIFYTLSLWLIKAGLVVFYKRLSGHTYSYLQKLYNATLVWLVISWLVILFDTIFRCYPLSRTWSRDPSDACPASAATINYWITVTFNISTDILIICLPISMVMKLNLPLKQKFGVAGIFALGFVVVITSIVRAVFSHRQQTMLTCTVSMIETSIAIITTCLPTLRIMILGHTSRKGTDSEDELVKELSQYPAQPSPRLPQSPREVMSFDGRISGETCVNSPKPNTIEITTEFTVVPEVAIMTIPEEAHTSDGQRSPSFRSVREP
ncbi:hypothetical protein GTA08_BOTSDO01369 [Neofusicoccum parvum]|nr:hypothetical protein GTA08_BOTSDO01369 [Neofusicoccum parvum]